MADDRSFCQPIMQNPKVTICIITYNQRRYVREAIESALFQDYDNLEIIISDDASTDGTVDEIRSMQMQYPQLITLLNAENGRVTRNCNRALSKRTGDFVTFLAGDDAFLPGKIRAQVEWMSRSPDHVLCTTAVRHVDADDNPYSDPPPPRTPFGQGPELFIRHGFVIPAYSVMVRASAIPAHGYDESIPLASDLLYAIEILSNGGKFGYVDSCHYKYRHLSNSASTRYFEMLADIERTYTIIGERYPQYRNICSEAYVRNVTYFGGVRHLKSGNKKAAREQFVKTLRSRPLYVKAWVRLLQTL